ncbi:hypothetical protein M9Y10_003323 [Tritrichomonas musculus]|uniref:DnaK protein n=1 Tax=Tritrichomonas musculus TaxID=1915356 RepID=A0ABR2JRX7_9EUKA
MNKIPYYSVVGIDLGTTFSTIGRVENNGQINLFKDGISSSEWIPSIVAYTNGQDIIVGKLALEEQRKHPENVITDAKRMLGHKYSDPLIQELSKKWLFKIDSDENGDILIKTSMGPKTPVEVCSEIIRYLIELASEQSANNSITHAIISVPANYSSRQRDETKKAGQMAGLEEVHLINEPTAGIISYWFSNYDDCNNFCNSKKVITFDFGGGTLDISIAEVEKNKIESYDVEGNMFLGGRDIDNNLVDYYLKKKKLKKFITSNMRKSGRDGENARVYMRKISEECERVKVAFSGRQKKLSILPGISNNCSEDEVVISFDEFQKLNKKIIDSILGPVDQIFKELERKGKNITKYDIDDILLVGGSSNNKFVIEKLNSYFGKLPIKDREPRNAVVNGAAIDARRRYVDNSIFFSDVKELKRQEVCPLTLGVGSIGDEMVVMIPRGTKIPYEHVHNFTIAHNFVKKVCWNIYETERVKTTKESFIGSINLDVPSRQAGKVPLRLKFSLDEDCILSVKAWVDEKDDDDDYFYYNNKEIIRSELPNRSPEFIKEQVDLGKKLKKQDCIDVDANRLESYWGILHKNVIEFIKKYRFDVDDYDIKEQLKDIESRANEEKNKKINSIEEYDDMIDEYRMLFNDYNNYEKITKDKMTDFLKYYNEIGN